LGAWSTFQFVKSIAGDFRSFPGHCAYNRRPGPQLIPDPDGERREVLQVARHPDPRLVYEKEGAVWNFPAGKAGELWLKLRLPSGSHGTRICLVDRWFNPVDPVVEHFAQYVLVINSAGMINGVPALAHDIYQELRIRWRNSEVESAEFQVGSSGKWTPMKLTRPSANGICYVHIQSLAEEADPLGLLLAEVHANVFY
jgi:hypothetical protein